MHYRLSRKKKKQIHTKNNNKAHGSRANWVAARRRHTQETMAGGRHMPRRWNSCPSKRVAAAMRAFASKQGWVESWAGKYRG